MKKIFLTSGLVLCMACPAFATGFNTDPYDADPQQLTQPGTCEETHLGVDHGSTILRAQWNAKTYDVTYNPCTTGGTGSAYKDEDGATYDDDYTPLTSQQTNIGAADGYVFLGWTKSSTPSYTRDQSPTNSAINTGSADNEWEGEDPWATDADLNVYAVCMPKQYDVTYSCGSGSFISGATESTVATYGTAFTQPDVADACEWAGHTPTAWSCTKGNDAVTVATGTWSIDGDVTCTAVWDTNTIRVFWTSDGTTSYTAGNPTTSCTYGDSVTLPTAPSKTGYEFDGWEVVAMPTAAECATAAQNNETLLGCQQ